MLRPVVLAGCLFAAPAAFAQLATQTPDVGDTTAGGGSKSMKELLANGYEIKSSTPNGTKFIVFMQKDKSAYACEFVSLTRSRCGAIN
ncbi:hypothetical protein E2F50_08700 [Rhizobium deserti]|uniref:Uncharacterized protein n=2 Tax=Rhizobium deserti TaxID=2547961 RepID=A0A4R5UJE6_9HYPH|nr:hypothetical protein [Rhizobium deserti]TDK36977.1 hypothetical protein E2F50_08700 [Rhizobium deserti]